MFPCCCPSRRGSRRAKAQNEGLFQRVTRWLSSHYGRLWPRGRRQPQVTGFSSPGKSRPGLESLVTHVGCSPVPTKGTRGGALPAQHQDSGIGGQLWCHLYPFQGWQMGKWVLGALLCTQGLHLSSPVSPGVLLAGGIPRCPYVCDLGSGNTHGVSPVGH